MRVLPQTLFRTLEDLSLELEPARLQRMARLSFHSSFTSDPIGGSGDDDDADDAATDGGAKSAQAGTLAELDRASELLIRQYGTRCSSRA